MDGEHFLSLDISSSCVGYAVWSDCWELVDSGVLKFKNIDFVEKLKQTSEWVYNMSQKYFISKIYIEEPLQYSIHTTPRTMAVLNFFVGHMVGCCGAYMTREIYFINFNSARSKCGIRYVRGGVDEDGKSVKVDIKKMVFDYLRSEGYELREIYNRKNNLDRKTYDISDAVFVGHCAKMNYGFINLFKKDRKRGK